MCEVKSKESVDIDEVLIKFSIFGRYHVWCLFLLMIVNITSSMASVNYIFTAEEVAYTCKDDQNATCKSYNSSHPCSEWIYENPNSLVAEFNLACQEWKRTLIGSVHSVGYMTGLSLVGPLSDRVGRKYTIVITSMAYSVFGALRAFSTNYWMYIALEFVEAMGGATFSPVYMLAVELVATQRRISYMTICNLGWHIGYALLSPVAWYFPYWRTLHLVIYLPNLLIFFYIFLLDESPRWLLTKGKKKEAARIIKKAAKWSKVDIDSNVLENLTFHEEKNIKFTELLRSTFASKTLLNRFFICTVWWTTCAFVSYGMIINSVSLQGSKYWNFSIMCMIDIPATVLNMCSLKYFKRKYSLMLTFFMGAVLCTVQPFIPLNIPWLSVALYMAGKMMSACYFDTTYLYTSELFPTYTRNSMHALCSSLGRIGSVVAPQTPLLMAYWTGLPPLIFGSVALFACILTFFVPDTSANSLPDTVKQAEAVGIGKQKIEGVHVE